MGYDQAHGAQAADGGFCADGGERGAGELNDLSAKNCRARHGGQADGRGATFRPLKQITPCRAVLRFKIL